MSKFVTSATDPESATRIANFLADISKIDSKFLSSVDRDSPFIVKQLEETWLPHLKNRVEDEAKWIAQNPAAYVETFLNKFGNTFSPLFIKPTKLGFEPEIILQLEQTDPRQLQTAIDQIKKDYRSTGFPGLFARLDQIRPLHPVYYWLKGYKKGNARCYSADLNVLHEQSALILRYFYAHSPGQVARALSFTTGLSVGHIYKVTRIIPPSRQNVYEAKFYVGRKFFLRYILTPFEDISPAFEWLRQQSYSRVRKLAKGDVFDPLGTAEIAPLHAFATLHLFQKFDNRPVEEFLRTQGLSPRSKLSFEMSGSSSVTELQTAADLNAEQILDRTCESALNIPGFSLTALKETIEEIQSRIKSRSVTKITKEIVQEWCGKSNELASAAATHFKTNLSIVVPQKPAIRVMVNDL